MQCKFLDVYDNYIQFINIILIIGGQYKFFYNIKLTYRMIIAFYFPILHFNLS